MSNIPNSVLPIQIEGCRTRSPISESLMQAIGGAINQILTTPYEDFLVSGNLVVPLNVSVVIVEAIGGGGGGAGYGGPGGDGGNTLFNGLIVGRGASGGPQANGSVALGPTLSTGSSNNEVYPGGNGGLYGTGRGTPGVDSQQYSGGDIGFGGASSYSDDGGGGGASDYGPGGQGGGASEDGQQGDGYGCGGGGACCDNNPISCAGGAGAKRHLWIINVTPGATIPVVVGDGGAAGISGGFANGGVGTHGFLRVYL